MNYGFGSRLTREFPSQIILTLTEKCNYSCVFCARDEAKKLGTSRDRELPFNIVKKAIDEASHYQEYMTQIRVTAAGEPLLYKDLFKVIYYIKKKTSIFTSLTTNGSLLKKEKQIELLNTGIDMIDISIDANTEETYKKVRRGGNLKKVKSNVLNLIELRKKQEKSTKVVVSFVNCPQNSHEAKDFEEYWYSQNADFVIIRKLHTFGGVFEGDTTRKRFPCVYPFERIFLIGDGDMVVCNDYIQNSSRGNISETSIREFWQSKELDTLREEILKNDYIHNKKCERCIDWQNMAWPEQEGRMYADLIEDFKDEK